MWGESRDGGPGTGRGHSTIERGGNGSGMAQLERPNVSPGVSRNGLRGVPSTPESWPKSDQKGDPRPEGGASRSAPWGHQVRCHTR